MGRSSPSRSSARGSWPRPRPTSASSRSWRRSRERRFAFARKVNLSGVVAEFAAGVLKELDYRNEAYHARRLADGMQRFPEIHVPLVWDELSGQRVITMEFVNGHQDLEGGRAARGGLRHHRARDRVHPRDDQAGPRRRVLPRRPAPGQRPRRPDLQADHLPRPRDSSGSSNAQQRVDLLGLIYSIKEVDIPGIGDGLLALGKTNRGFDEARYRDDIDRLARQYLVYGKATSLGDALGAFLSAVFNNGVQLDSQLTLAIKAVIQAEETARALSFDIDLGEAAVTEARAAFMDSFTPDKIQKQLQGTAIRIGKELARKVPSLEGAALSWIDQFNKGKFVVEVDTSGLEKSIGSVSAIGRQATVGIIVVGQLIGTAIVMAVLLQPELEQFQGIAYIAMIAFAVTLIVSFIVLFRVFFDPTSRDDV